MDRAGSEVSVIVWTRATTRGEFANVEDEYQTL